MTKGTRPGLCADCATNLARNPPVCRAKKRRRDHGQTTGRRRPPPPNATERGHAKATPYSIGARRARPDHETTGQTRRKSTGRTPDADQTTRPTPNATVASGPRDSGPYQAQEHGPNAGRRPDHETDAERHGRVRTTRQRAIPGARARPERREQTRPRDRRRTPRARPDHETTGQAGRKSAARTPSG